MTELEGEIVGYARARFLWKTSAENVGELWGFVRPSRRNHGLGDLLYEAAVAYLREHGAQALLSWAEQEPGRRFLRGHGYRATREERVSALEIAQAPLAELLRLEQAKAAEGFRLVPLSALLHRPRDVHALYAAALGDVPETFATDYLPYEDWERHSLGQPQLTAEGSFLVIAGDRPVSFSFLQVDPPLAANEMTGTLPEFRGRGLARLAKLGSIRWAAENGIETILTANDEENAAMLALNESLAYRAVATGTQFVRED